MISKSQIDEAVKRLVKTYNPLAIYLFGSYAWGTPTEESDVDFFVIVDETEIPYHKRPRTGEKSLWKIGFSTDLIVVTKEEFERKIAEKTSLYHKIKNEGALEYEAA